MGKSFFRFIFFILLAMIPAFGRIAAGSVTGADSSFVEVRKPDPGFSGRYLKQKEFSYLPVAYNPNLLKRIYDYIREKLFGWGAFMDKLPFVYKLFMWLLVVVFLIVAVTRTKLYRIFYTDTEINSPFIGWTAAETQTVDYDQEISNQVGKHEYRLAIRLLFLKAIQKLRAKDYIWYSKEKTNIDYLHDLPLEQLKPLFLSVTSIFNHVWYGETEIEEGQFIRFQQSFQLFYNAIDVQE